MTKTKRALLYLQAIFYVGSGINHLVNPAFYVAIMPPDLPDPEWLNVFAGLAEIVLGVFLLDRRARPYAAWGIIALLLAVFPANLYVAMENVGIPSGEPGTGNATANILRLPFQLLFLLWAWWYTRPPAATARADSNA